MSNRHHLFISSNTCDRICRTVSSKELNDFKKNLAMALKKAFMKNILIFSWIINISQKLFVLLQEDLLKASLFTR